ncbi:hypothetical protein HMPREF1601_01984 [Escherichia coli 907779]|nr:hypothetical protein HMPREF1601_01984 [Escherichia coli 907779]ESC97194.1 hypothetical protein HMPREF1594_02445 [Escherichia coli 907446]ESD12531.1 hypothetical protein HMPREF1596_02434 [Escherichia coli 907700]ESD15818.1 hypothetical protein HMPREF1597_04369 [Escherichia coli 907701]ESD56598.1 hypothetical protein HMPREF1607_02931 [Escherichia coli 908524]ESD95202.1 hypothetical protein HMPREF1614_04141 [Escherichia coli 908624]ESD99422.1 hypothetical protein HMPREF1615_04873 [Escherichia
MPYLIPIHFFHVSDSYSISIYLYFFTINRLKKLYWYSPFPCINNMPLLINLFIKQSTNNDRHRELCYEKTSFYSDTLFCIGDTSSIPCRI